MLFVLLGFAWNLTLYVAVRCVAKALYLPKCLGDELPDGMREQLLAMLEGVGRLLVKAIFDGQPVPAPFAPSL